ncbi:tRNA adenosine deaminase-associated protein [Nocardiopsis aegyptia]|uniref:Putative tRNA adenosine deaminase-associated protein n=1 Tax=Nocardiopsis aegyptia TaxID=220378 RepID=A0A7Z0ENQ2_9ACTN|nr:tRNA adenosine deaminase-associated protein [Nocardiopsis aegyptia]NYJ35187.1 putative tRNA adenosine deaminase-associated protein [Nocardiopsis aegyptia]
MSIFAAVFAPNGKTWRGTEVDLGDVDVIDDVTDLMVDFAVERGGDLSLLLIEADDEWFALVRAEEDGEPRVYLSDARVVHDHALAAVLSEAGGLGAPQPAESAGARPNPAPDGDGRLLTDLGITEDELRSLSVGGGVLPSDVLAVVAERAGFAELLDDMRL